MNPSRAIDSKPLLGEVRPILDGKNRITIPADWREIIGGNEIYLLPSVDDPCLKLFPPAEMQRLRALVDEKSGTERTEALRWIGSKSRCLRWDGQGRCVLPDEYCKEYHLTGEIVLAAATNTLELWTVKNWEAAKPKTGALTTETLRGFGV